MSYKGNVATIPLGQIGLLTDVPPSEVPRGALIRANNVSFETGSLTKASGSLRYNTTPFASSIVALWDWWPDLVTQRMIAVTADGHIYRDIGDHLFNNNTAIRSNLGMLTPKSMFVEGGNETGLRQKKLFFFSSTNLPQVLAGDGTNFANISSPASDWTTPNFPAVGVVHRNRLWAFMKQRAYASDTGDHENFSSNFITQSIYPGEGGDIVGAYAFKGRLFSFKENGFVYYLDDSNVDSTNWFWTKLASNFGLASSHGIVEAIDDLIAVNEAGTPISYNATNALGGIESADILRLLQISEYFRENTSLSGVKQMHAIYYPHKKQAFFTWRTSYKPTNNMLFHMDFNRQSPRTSFWTKDSAECLALRRDVNKIQRPIYGSSDGYVYLMDREDRLVGGSGYTGEFKTGHMDFRFLNEQIAQKNKLYDWLAVEFIPQGTWNLSVDVYIDGNFSETINFPMNLRADGLGNFQLGHDLLGREESLTLYRPLHGSGRRIAFHCKNTGSNQNFAISSLSVGFRLSGEQATRV